MDAIPIETRRLDGLTAWPDGDHHIVEFFTPRAQRPYGPSGGDVRQRVAALTAAYHAAAGPGPAIVYGWTRQGGADRDRAGADIRVLIAATSAAAATTAGETQRLSLPIGALGRRLPVGQVWREFAATPRWLRIAAVRDVMLAESGVPPISEVGRVTDAFEVWRGQFAWVMVAAPLPMSEIRAAAMLLSQEHLLARSRSTPEHEVRARRLADLHEELRRAEIVGRWRVALLAGADTDQNASVVAGLLCATLGDLRDTFSVAPVGRPGQLAELLDDTSEPSAPFSCAPDQLAELIVVPQREIPGIRLVDPADFDVTPEPASINSAAGLVLGQVLDRTDAAVGEMSVDPASVNRHVLVAGATGSGKSETIRSLLTQLTRADVPWLVIEPAKAEYRAMAARPGGPPTVVVLRPGDPGSCAAGLNPLEPEPGFPLQTHLDLVKALFVASFDAQEPFPQIVTAALVQAYEELGWDLAAGELSWPNRPPVYPRLSDLSRTALQVVERVGYGREVADNVRGFVRVRLASLRLGATGRFLEGGHPLDVGRLLHHRVVLEIEDVGDDADKAFLMGVVLIRLVERLRVTAPPVGGEPGLRHVTVVEEAHRLLRRQHSGGAAAHAIELLAALLAEIRAYGEGVIIAEQIPTKLAVDVVRNTAVKILHRLPSSEDRSAVGTSMNLTEDQSRHVVSLRPGVAAVFVDGMDRPVRVRIPDPGRPLQPDFVLADPSPLAEARSSTCPDDCRRRLCTVRELARARRLSTTARMSLWAEFAVVAHLAGGPAPAAPPSAARTVPDPRIARCAVGQAVDAAVWSRVALVMPMGDPHQFADHVQRCASGSIERCRPASSPWLLPHARREAIIRALRYRVGTGATGRHPATERWAVERGTEIPGQDCREQLRAALAIQRDESRPELRRAALHGTGSPSVIEAAVGCAEVDATWPPRFFRATAPFSSRDWLRRIYAAPAEQEH
ncbi:ATP-binding protein [Micromonospora marina]|uniref:ATP-binding protein n=1 Tax=Micromonospora marina TaxID=307120 RepID=UPI00345125CD